MSNTPPSRIWLQWHGDGSPDDIGEVDPADVTWCGNSVFDHDIEYVRADALPKCGCELGGDCTRTTVCTANGRIRNA